MEPTNQRREDNCRLSVGILVPWASPVSSKPKWLERILRTGFRVLLVEIIRVECFRMIPDCLIHEYRTEGMYDGSVGWYVVPGYLCVGGLVPGCEGGQDTLP